MSTIKSSAEHLTLNADGANNDIIFQSNGSNVATLDQAGTLTATTFSGTGATPSITDGGNATAITIDANENVGIGQTSPSSGLSLPTFLHIGNSSTTQSGIILEDDEQKWEIAHNGDIAYRYNTTPYFRIGSTLTQVPSTAFQVTGGDVRVGMSSRTETVSTNAAAYFAPTGSDNAYATLFIVHNSAQKHGIVLKDMNSSGGPQLDFRNSSGTQVGSISASASAATYNTSSDYRLKENVDYTWDATTRLKQLKPARFNWIVDDTNTLVDGFIAHEVSGIVPEAISGTKDAMVDQEYEITPAVKDEEGNIVTEAVMGTRSVPDHQGIDQSKLVPLLTKALQEQQTTIEALEARITALEA